MSNQDTLEKAVQKAIDGGWCPIGVDPTHPQAVKALTEEGSDKCYILTKSFAKALWGVEPYAKVIAPHPHYDNSDDGTTKALHILPYWQYHLQQMVIAEDPIKYLGDNL